MERIFISSISRYCLDLKALKALNLLRKPRKKGCTFWPWPRTNTPRVARSPPAGEKVAFQPGEMLPIQY